MTDKVTLSVHAYDWVVRDRFGDDDRTAIHCWALDRESKPHLVRFVDFPVFCQLELPRFVYNRAYTWSDAAVNQFVNMLNARLGEDAPIRHSFRMSRKLYYYRGAIRHPILQLCFNNLEAMRHCSNLFFNSMKTEEWGFIKCNVWETEISTVRKLLTVQNVRYSQWFNVTASKVDNDHRISTTENEYIAEWNTMKAIPSEICKNWITQPMMLAFDMECYSDNHRAMPDKYNSLHVAYMISCIAQRYRDASTRKRYGIIIGDCGHIPPERLSNCEIITVDSEYEMIEAFARVVKEVDPEILTGYNILSFDYPYLDHRVKRWLKQWPHMGRIMGEVPTMESKIWRSGAYGCQSNHILMIEGRISVDLLPIVRRDYKLDKYTLDFVCKTFINKTKHDVKATEMFKIFEDMRNTLAELVKVLREAQTNPELSQDPEYLIRKEAAQAAYEKAKTDTTRVMEYCIQDSELVIELMEKLHTWVGLVELSNIVGTTIVELFTRGQQVRCLSQLYDIAARSGYVLDKREEAVHSFTGGAVFDTIPGLFNRVICLDFSSLYPSIIRAMNICFTTLVPQEFMEHVPDEDCNIIEFDQEEDEEYMEDGPSSMNEDREGEGENEEVLQELTEKVKKTRVVSKHYKFKFYKKQEALLPELERRLVEERSAVRATIRLGEEELKYLEKTNTLAKLLFSCVNGEYEILSLSEAKKRLDAVSGGDIDVVAKAKKSVVVAEAFDVDLVNKHVAELKDSDPSYMREFHLLEQRIATLHQQGKQEELSVLAQELLNSVKPRERTMDDIKMLNIVLDKRQNALKVSANSFFGFLGARNGGKRPLMEGAMSITATGRQLIGKVHDYIEKNYQGKQIAGDTDSIMFVLPNVKTDKETNYWGNRLAEEISGIKPGKKDCDGKLWPEGRPGLFPPPLGMEFEKAMRMLCLKKKKYAAFLIGKDGNFKTENVYDKQGNVVGNKLYMLKRGIVLARRDNCGFLRTVYSKILSMIMECKPLEDAIDYLVACIQEMLDGKIPVEQLVTIREMGINYKSESYFMKVFGEQLKKQGKIVNPGDRLDFVIVEDPTATLLGHKMRLLEQYQEKVNTPAAEKLDYNYYIEKALMNPINQLFEIGFKDDIAQLQHFTFRPSNRHKHIHLDRPVQMILKMREKNQDLKHLTDGVRQHMAKVRSDREKPASAPVQLTLRIVQPPAPAPPPVTAPPKLTVVPSKPNAPAVLGLILPNVAKRPPIPMSPAPTPTPAPQPKLVLKIVKRTT
jgi:DNA polymerase elongation subunit (family B)